MTILTSNKKKKKTIFWIQIKKNVFKWYEISQKRRGRPVPSVNP